MNRKTVILLLSSLAVLLLSSCLEDRESRRWREGNEDFMASLKDSANVFPLEINDELLAGEQGASYQPAPATGIYYREISRGKGPLPLVGQSVLVAYTGWLYDGTQFDDGDISFTLGSSTIEGFTHIVQRMPVGSVWKVFIPYYLGYGTVDYIYSTPTIPAYSTLVFKMELKSATD
ncbi:MAG: FKBP-type peptidyl-prolyl cis-trans isomerase [Bacteroidales bacterium]|nr:FKBP-type peptidyl-prolyl cis-trans isomerase [Bacteroidales bacterium]